VNREAVPDLGAHLCSERVRQSLTTVNVEVVDDQGGLGLRVLQRQFTGDSGELESGAVRCGEREVAARLRLYSAENISRAATLLVVAPRFAPRLGRRSPVALGMQRDRPLVQAPPVRLDHTAFRKSPARLPSWQYSLSSSDTVAVGMPVTRHPPHRSPRAALPHEAPILDGWRQSEPGGMDGEHAAAESTDQPASASAPK
jgi:hypothetical protein